MTRAHSILKQRRAGILLHISSLPGGIGNGDLGQNARDFVDFLARCGVSVWQTLPVGPTHEDGSPYQCMSVHAGDPLLINLEWLRERGWLPQMPLPAGRESASGYRLFCLREAHKRFKRAADEYHRRIYADFARDHAWWLSDYALYAALRREFRQQPWQSWPIELRDCDPAALQAARLRLSDEIEYVNFEQFLFYRQWQELRDYARSRHIILFGDMPIFVASDSADVWACREYFDLREDGHPRVVAGVPPDYFSQTGQRWGNPHYNWARMEADGFRWWIQRLSSQLELYDWVRIDHFRGFEAYWEIPAEEPTAINGRWVKAPGEALLTTLFDTFDGDGLPLVAENLGIITPEVEALREEFNIPGMLILQFAFDSGADNPYLPQHHCENEVVYTGTHDNDTTLSWYENLPKEQQPNVSEYLGIADLDMPRALVECALGSVARLAMLPMQDVLGLGAGYRMNTPGTVGGRNWRWRFKWAQVTQETTIWLSRCIRKHDRVCH